MLMRCGCGPRRRPDPVCVKRLHLLLGLLRAEQPMLVEEVGPAICANEARLANFYNG